MEGTSSDESTVRIDEYDHERWIKELKEELKKGKWETIEGIIRKNPTEPLKAKLNDNGDTLLLLAFKGGKKGLSVTKNLVDMMSSDSDLLAETDNFGNTALHIAANVGVVRDARKLVGNNESLVNIFNKDGLLPIQIALSRRDLANAYFMASYLLGVMKEERNSAQLKDAAGASVMQSLVKAGFYELALDLLHYNKNLAWEGDISPLQQMASDPGGFGSGRRLSGWSSLIYSLKYIGKFPFLYSIH
ncbi:uncharacterized protein LOC111375879 [Olea europaea var. sylvestris]|uniref:uncharacterized protein LOC111375879 n=1 Tax=Olea europaea var. sylvestris TaxID=158386 RepID=UPI000C1D8B9D|nr:uncharacterized protein LOC111375879 [Olea europaea var. sylvestris]